MVKPAAGVSFSSVAPGVHNMLNDGTSPNDRAFVLKRYGETD